MIYPLPKKLTITTISASTPIYLAVPEYKGYNVKITFVRNPFKGEAPFSESSFGSFNATQWPSWKRILILSIVIIVIPTILIYLLKRRSR